MRRSPGWFNHRNSGVWQNCRRSAVSIIDTSGERHSQLRPVRPITHLTPRSCFPSEDLAGEPTHPSFVEKITSADSVLEIEPKRTSSGRNPPARSSGEPHRTHAEAPGLV